MKNQWYLFPIILLIIIITCFILNYCKQYNSIEQFQNEDIKLIHIGKCGGTNIINNFNLKQIHMQIPKDDNANKYIIWIRNPLNRFVSAFNYSKDIVNHVFDGIIPKSRQNIILKNTYSISEEYDDLINKFETANDLAEAINSENDTLRESATKLMNHTQEHIYKGIGFYLQNGDFIKNNFNKILFVGSVENMEDDILKLSKLINKNNNLNNFNRKNVNKHSKFLSKRAINNLLEFYKDTDYKALHTLHEYGFIDKHLLNSYYEYNEY